MLNVVILAAGQGTRMQSDLPKVLHTLAGQTMLAHVVGTARQLEPERIVVVTGHGAEAVHQHLAGQNDVYPVVQEPQQGTGHAVLQALPALDAEAAGSVTLVLYGDVPLVQASTLRELLAAGHDGVAILTEHIEDPAGYGRIVRDDGGNITGIVEDRDASAQQRMITEINTGILVAPTSWLQQCLPRLRNDNAQGEYYLTDIVAMAVADGVAVHAAHPGSPWETQGVNSRAQQAQLERAWQAEQARRLLEQGVSLADPQRLDIRGTLVCGRDVFIDVGCVFEGHVELADGVHIGPHCVLRSSRLGAGTRVEAFSHVDQAVMGAKVSIGPYARLRPGTQLEADVHIGNFVEVKNSVFGPGSKANHLSYVGDATLGSNVNIGAGTITCNYDGASKHETIIEDDVFIGSDTQLVAPVRVGRGATIGAGSTITHDAPEGRLTLSRTPQKTIFGWNRPKRKS